MKLLLFFSTAWLLAQSASAVSVSLSAARDNTLFENATGSQSNAKGESFFAARTGPNEGSHIRRGALAFDIGSAVPAGATITGVALTLFLAQGAANSSGKAVSLYAFSSHWGEATSFSGGGSAVAATSGDVTWLHGFYNTSLWKSAGGDFAPQSHATTSITTDNSFYAWSDSALVADVQSWLDTPALNFGWMVRGDEVTLNSALRFSSREAAVEANRPQLTITYSLVPEPSAAALFFTGALAALRSRRPGKRPA